MTIYIPAVFATFKTTWYWGGRKCREESRSSAQPQWGADSTMRKQASAQLKLRQDKEDTHGGGRQFYGDSKQGDPKSGNRTRSLCIQVSEATCES